MMFDQRQKAAGKPTSDDEEERDVKEIHGTTPRNGFQHENQLKRIGVYLNRKIYIYI